MKFSHMFSRRATTPAFEADPKGMSPYSSEIVQLLESRFALESGAVGAEIGAGKGRLAELFLKHGYPLLATEDDPADRALCEQLKDRFPQLTVIAGSPTATHLADASVDFILSERALFEPDQEAVKREFRRILRPGGPVLIITDSRIYAGGRQTEEYNDILRRHCIHYKEKLLPYDIPAALANFFSGNEVYEDAFVGVHSLTLQFFMAQNRALEIYPAPADPARRKLEAELTKFFLRWAINGKLLEPVVCRVACARFEDMARETQHPAAEALQFLEPVCA